MSLQGEAPGGVLVLTPTGRDGGMVCDRLQAAGFGCELCPTLEAVLANLPEAGAAVLAEEALSPAGAEALLAALDAQEPWSDVPILLLTFPLTMRAPHAHAAIALFERANVTLLQRPLRAQLLLSAVRSAVRARRRQFEVRDLHRELARALQLSDMFVSILGHDLRTPLAAIRLSAEQTLRGSQDAPALRRAGRILTSVDRMGRMIEQLLDLARVRQGQGIALQIRPADLRDVCQPVLQEIEDAHPDARIELVERGDLSGAWDPDRIAQVVSNLTENAVQHGTKGRPIRLALDGGQPETVHARVESEGVIPAELLPTLFDAFKRATRGRARTGGLGLGLFIARELARAHGGDIAVDTAEGSTVFAVSLPRHARPTPTTVSTPA